MASAYIASVCSGTISCGAATAKALSGSVTLNKEEIEVCPMVGTTIAYPEQVVGGKVWAEYDVTFAFSEGSSGFSPDALVSCTFNIGSSVVSFSAAIHKCTITKGESGVVTGQMSGKSSGTVTYV